MRYSIISFLLEHQRTVTVNTEEQQLVSMVKLHNMFTVISVTILWF